MPKVHDLKLNPPTKKTELNKKSMLNYIKAHGTDEDKKWFINLLETNIEKKTNNLTKEVINGYDIPAIRNEFAKRFFPDLLNKKKPNKNKKSTFEEELKELKASIS